jgi:polysaccharide export outer membrane protein
VSTLRIVLGWCALLSASLAAQSPNPANGVTQVRTPVASPVGSTDPSLPKDYVIGVEDVLNIVFWRDKDLSAEVTVRPDGKISLPILNDVPAAGMTPLQLAATLQQAAAQFVRDSGATVIVKEVHSRKVYVVGEVAKPGTYALGGEMNVMQLIAQVGGFAEDAKKNDVVIVRTENGKEHRFKFNYGEVVRGKNVQQNIQLLPGDMILVR